MPFKIHPQGVTAAVKLMPGARKTECAGVGQTADGPALKIFVNAVPDEGRANHALVLFLASALDVPRSAFSLLSGEKRRLKVVLVKGESAFLMKKLTDWLAQIDNPAAKSIS